MHAVNAAVRPGASVGQNVAMDFTFQLALHKGKRAASVRQGV
jgi:hypothetical protein